jgi:hypothetical protein
MLAKPVSGEPMNSGKLNKHLLMVDHVLVAPCATRFTYLHVADTRVSIYQPPDTKDWPPPLQ